MGPEIRHGAEYDGKLADAWSAGIVLYAMLCGRVPFKGKTLEDLKRRIQRNSFDRPEHLGTKVVELLEGLINVDPRYRSTVGDALSHDWLKGVVNRAEVTDHSSLLSPLLEGNERDRQR